MTNIKRMSEQDFQKCFDLLNLIDDLMKSEKSIRGALKHGDEWFPIRDDAFDVMADGILKYITDYSYRSLYNMHIKGRQTYMSKFTYGGYSASGFTMDVVRELIFYRSQEISKEDNIRFIEKVIEYHFHVMGLSEDQVRINFMDFISVNTHKTNLLNKIEALEAQIAEIRKELK